MCKTIATIKTNVFVALCAMLLLVSCKPGVPGDYLQPGKMADILYEFQMAQTLYDQQGGDSLTLLSYRANIFKKNGVTEAEFDSSMVYYARHTRLLYDVYKKVGDRLNNELMAQGGSSMSMAQYGENIASGDTASIWKGDMCFALTPYQADNIYTYEAKADTSYHKGDRIILDFDAQFVYQEGVRNAVAVLTVTFANDSVASEVSQLTSSSHYHIQIEDTRKVGIKDVKGYFMLGNSLDEGPSTTLRLAVFYNIQLLKMHIKEVAADSKNAAATLNGAQTDMQPLPSESGSSASGSSASGSSPQPVSSATDPVEQVSNVKPIRPVKMLPIGKPLPKGKDIPVRKPVAAKKIATDSPKLLMNENRK